MIKITDSNVTVMVKDMDMAIHFYQKIGLTLKQRWENYYAMMTAPGITIGLHPVNETELGESSLSIGFMVDNIGEARTLLEENKIDYKQDIDGKSGIYLYFKDLDGTVLYYVEPKWN
ncbi:MAG: VOC family protein [Parafilimonas sp.]